MIDLYKKIFHTIGWLFLIGMGISWLWIGYSSWYLVILPIAYISFAIHDGSIKELEQFKHVSLRNLVLILFSFVISVAIVISLIQFASFLINDIFYLTGWIKTLSEVLAVIVSLYPMKFTFWSIVENKKKTTLS